MQSRILAAMIVAVASLAAGLERMTLITEAAEPYGSLSWQQLVQKLRQAAASQRGNAITRAPAAAAAVEAAERRLGVALPKSYRAFLAVSNGLEKYDEVAGVEILRIEQVVWLRDVEGEAIDLLSQHGPKDVARKLRQSLLIGSASGIPTKPTGTEWLLLVPTENSAAEWECWFFAHWVPGQWPHQTFRHLIESELQKFAKR